MPKTSTSFSKDDPRINRDGRPPKEWTMTALYREAGEEATTTGEPRKKIVARKLWEIAQKGDVTAIKELGNRIDGMPKQAIDHTTDGEKIEGNTIIFKDFSGTNSNK